MKREGEERRRVTNRALYKMAHFESACRVVTLMLPSNGGAQRSRATQREHISTHEYLKVSFLHVAGLSLMSSTVKVIWMRFS